MKIQFFDTISQIIRSDSINPIIGIIHHIKWQYWRFTKTFPKDLSLSRSQLLFPVNSSVAALVNCMGLYDFNNMSLLQRVMAAEKTILLDIGANIGSYTLISSEVEESLTVSFEPHPVTFTMLEMNIEHNNRKNVLALNLAVSDKDGIVAFLDNEGSSLNRIVENPKKDTNIINVPARRIDSVCKDYHIQPSYVKIDVEGHEKPVLIGMGSLLERVNFVIVERGESNGTAEFLISRNFIGPFYYHSKEKTFSHKIQNRAEDPVFINKFWFEKARKLGFRFP